MDWRSAINSFISYFFVVVFFFPVDERALFSSGHTLSLGQRKVDAEHAALQRDTRSPTSGSVSNVASWKVCSKYTDNVKFDVFNSSCLMCAVSVDFKENACPFKSRPVSEAVRGCTFETENYGGHGAVFSFEGCNFECVNTKSDNFARECCHGFWGPLCSECPDFSSYPCSSHGRCDDGRNGTGICSCEDGHSGTACEVCSGDSCPEKQACRYNSDCHVDALCELVSNGSASGTCQCLYGYHGDGVECYTINPCLDNSHHCPNETTLCIYDGPNQYHCECKPGYTEFQEGCFRDECLTNSTQISCATGAECATISPGEVVCQCGPGYVGNGLVCYGNIMERLEYLNRDGGDLNGRLTQTLMLLEASLMHRWLRDRDVFYTVFLPVDETPQFVNTELAAQLEAGLLSGSDGRSDDFLDIVAKLHIVPGYVDSPILERIRYVYSLAGQEIVVGQDSTNLTISLEGDAKMASVIYSDLPASNGVIHVIDRLLLPTADVNHRVQGSMLDVLSSYNNLGTFTGMIKSVEELRSALDSDKVSWTLFAVTDDALLKLRQSGIQLSYLFYSAGLWEKFVKDIFDHHMAPIQLSSHDLLKAEGNLNKPFVEIRVSENGHIKVAGIANITTPDIAATNGVIHIIDAMLLPSSFFRMPETCYLNQSEGQVEECCLGFYSPLCIPCSSWCNGNGQPDDGINGSGICICEAAFDGEECQLCEDNTMYGPYCNQSCSCIHGVCNNGPWGTGHCQPDTCLPGYMGEDCHLQTTPCGPQEDQCHAHSMCIIEEGVPRCVCNTHYTGTGLDCLPINPCEQPDQGGCDPAIAECIYTGPGMHRCRCKEGYRILGGGGGEVCTSRDRCHGDNGGCHQDAICLHQFALDLIECICRFGFEGNGYTCEPINACLRPHDCDPEAQCETTGPGTYECVCPPGWRLDKRDCYSNLAVELSSLPEAEPFWKLIQAVSLDGFISHINHSLGIIVPPLHMIQLINSTTQGALGIQRIAAYFVRSHIFTMDQTQRYQNQTLPSLQPGEEVIIHGPNGDLSFIDGHFARVQNATNGLIFHSISYPLDYWMNYTLLKVQRKIDLLTPSSGDVQDYSQAWQLIRASRLLPKNSTPFTVFLPDNLAMSTFNQSVKNTDYFLEHHIVIGKTLFYHNISEEHNITTVSRKLLYFSVSNEKASVDMIPIEAPDILILPNGVAHGIPGLLSSSLREGTCDDRMNGGCHDNARCIQNTSTMFQCQCLDGFHGDGVECVAIDPCSHDNGGCHFRAVCILVGQGERRCSCNYGYEGDGIICLGSILEELRSIPEASLFVEFLANLDSQSFLIRGDAQFTVFVPSSEAITSFLQQQGLLQEWREERYTYLLTQYVLYHVIAGSQVNMVDLRNRTMLGTMNGQDLGVTINQGSKIMLGANATFLSTNLNASNGIIHIIDTMLIPPKIYEWPIEQDMETGSDEYDSHHHAKLDRNMEALGSSHSITTFLQLLNHTPMFQEFFIDARPPPGYGGPPPRRPPPHHPQAQVLPVWPGSSGNGREDRHGRGGYRQGPGGIHRDGLSGINETFSGQPRPGGIHRVGSGRGYGGGGADGGSRSSPQWQERPHRGSRVRLRDLHRTGTKSGASRDVYGIHGDGERRRHNRDFDTHGHYQKRSLDRFPGSRPHVGHPPSRMRHGGRFDRDSTIFAPSDDAFQRLPPGKLEELVDPDNRLLLQEFIAHHVLPEERYFADLWPVTKQYAVSSLQGSDLRISIMGQGELFVNERSRVVGVGLEFEGGVLYPVSEVISLPKMDGRCDVIETRTRMSRCRKCGSHMCPHNSEQVGAEQKDCRFHGGWFESIKGCQAECQFTQVTKACCQGYYGNNCLECPGGSTFPCNNHGFCNEGYNHDGTCFCHEGFTGTACERCLPGFYGPSCKRCRCSNSSICYGQSGECFCSADRDGSYCDHILTIIPSCDPPCHQNAVCRHGNRCQCSPQYHGDGFTCDTINQCFSENGGCSVHATCSHNASAINVDCTCHDGYHGDGVVCLPVNLCEEDNGGCHPNATCRFRGPNSRSCLCRPPYWGDGLECYPPVTSCLTNNGRCSPNAHCQDGQDGGPIECTCFSGYVGDGVLCNGNLYDTLASQPEFYHFFKMVTRLANQSQEGKRLVRDLLKNDDPLTIFIPLDPVLSGLTFYPSQVLLHVVHDRWSKEDLLEEGEDDEDLETWSGHALSVDVKHNHHHQTIVTIQDVPVVRFGMNATNGVIHMIEAPLPIWIVPDYDEDDDDDDQENKSDMMTSGWNSASRIFAAVAVPLGLFAFILVVVLYWFRGRKIRELTLQNQSQQGTTSSAAVVQRPDAVRPSMPLPPPHTPPVSPVSSVDQGDIQYSEFDQLMSAETGEKVETHLETRC